MSLRIHQPSKRPNSTGGRDSSSFVVEEENVAKKVVEKEKSAEKLHGIE
jgi:hypothetical protein